MLTLSHWLVVEEVIICNNVISIYAFFLFYSIKKQNTFIHKAIGTFKKNYNAVF